MVFGSLGLGLTPGNTTGVSSGAEVPIGSILPWLKTFTGTPALPGNWVECGGQVLSDSESVYNGETIPNLNGNNNFLRGNATSGGTGGAATHTHTDGAHNHTSTFDNGSGATKTEGFGGGEHTHAATSNLPPYYNVVWIMRVR